jgi:hypothetical protein
VNRDDGGRDRGDDDSEHDRRLGRMRSDGVPVDDGGAKPGRDADKHRGQKDVEQRLDAGGSRDGRG